MAPVIQRSVLQAIDFRLQPVTTHLVFPPSGDRAPVAIDSWRIKDAEFQGFVRGEKAPRVVMPADAGWVVYSRLLVKILSTEDALREGIGHRLAMRGVEREMLKGEPPEPPPTIVVMPELGSEDPNVGQYL